MNVSGFCGGAIVALFCEYIVGRIVCDPTPTGIPRTRRVCELVTTGRYHRAWADGGRGKASDESERIATVESIDQRFPANGSNVESNEASRVERETSLDVRGAGLEEDAVSDAAGVVGWEMCRPACPSLEWWRIWGFEEEAEEEAAELDDDGSLALGWEEQKKRSEDEEKQRASVVSTALART